MLTADPEGFPLGLAELGLKKPKAGGENTRVARETESSLACGTALARAAPSQTEESQDLSQPEAEGARAARRDAPKGAGAEGTGAEAPAAGSTDRTGRWPLTVSQGLDQQHSVTQMVSEADFRMGPSLFLLFTLLGSVYVYMCGGGGGGAVSGKRNQKQQKSFGTSF